MEFKQKFYYYKSENIKEFLKKYYQYADISFYLSEASIGTKIGKECYLYIEYEYQKHLSRKEIGLIKIWPSLPQFYDKNDIINVRNEEEFDYFFKKLVKIRYDLANNSLEDFIKSTTYELNYRKNRVKRLEEIINS